MAGVLKHTGVLRDDELLQNLKLCQIMIPAIEQAKVKVKLMQKRLVIITKMIRVKMRRNAQRGVLPVLCFSGRGEIQVFRPI
jgi:hypothetical protein